MGTFSPEGTFAGAAHRLDHLVDLGVDAVELMPVAEFPGRRGWGYDGVDLWAPHHAYGGPEGLAALVDACHARGLGVVLDVVYNHLGPAGNYLGEFGPYFTDRHPTGWGPGLNVDGPGSDEVRAFVVDNACMWLRDYHLDGLRLDAVHAIVDESAVHVLEQLATAVAALGAEVGRPLWLVAECDRNDPRLRAAAGGGRLRAGGDLGGRAGTTPSTRRSPASGTATTWTTGRWRRWPRRCARAGCTTACTRATATGSTAARRRGCAAASSWSAPRTTTRSATGPPATGSGTSSRRAGRCAAAALLLTAPFVPLLFQGEEWGASTPFPYFTDHDDPDLGRAVSRGPPARVRRLRLAPGGRPRPAGPGDVRPGGPALGRAGRAGARRDAGLVPVADRPPPPPTPPSPPVGSTTVGDVGRGRGLARRPARRAAGVTVAVNLGAEPQDVPVPGGGRGPAVPRRRVAF